MNKKIRIIDILKIIANGEQPPKRIKSEDRVFYFKEDETSIDYLYRVDKTGNGWLVVQDLALNDEVEILEDNTEEIEEIKGWGLATDYKDFETINHTLDRFGNKINELVKIVNELRKEKKDAV